MAGLIVASCGDSNDTAAESSDESRWQSQIGSDLSDTSFGVAAAPNGDIVVAGVTEGTLANESFGLRDIYIERSSETGESVWAIQLGTEANDSPLGVSVAPDGSIYAAGFTEGSLAAENAGSADVWIGRFDADGNELWLQQFGADQWDRGFDVTAFDGGAYVSGYTASVLDPDTNQEGFDGYAARFDSDGNLEWLRQFGSDATDWGQGSSLAPDGGLYVTGYTEGDMDGANAGDKDGFVIRLTPEGEMAWVRQFGSAGLDWTQGVETSADGGVVLAGSTTGDVSEANVGERDALLVAFDENGEPQFQTQFGTEANDAIFEVRATNDGYVATGSTESDLAGAIGERDGFLVWFDSSGATTAINQIGSDAVDDLTGLDVTSDGAIVYSGSTFGDVAGNSGGDADIFFGTSTGPTDG